MDSRLDFFNTLNKYANKLTDNDALLVLSHNKKDGDCITLLAGDWQLLSSLFSVKGIVNFSEGDIKQFENIKKMILNTAFNICVIDTKYKDKFIKGLNNI